MPRSYACILACAVRTQAMLANHDNIVFEVEGSFVELFELKHFPFDHQSVTAKLRIQCALEGKVPVVFTGLHTAVEVVDAVLDARLGIDARCERAHAAA